MKKYDYSQNGVYFVTICAKNHENLFGKIVPVVVGAAFCRPQSCHPPLNAPELNEIGQTIKYEVERLSTIYTNATVDKYVIMPNHVHMIISIANNESKDEAPAISRIVNQWKRAISIKAGFSPWQKSFHDHIIRNEEDYIRIAEYIESNPSKWQEDRYHTWGDYQSPADKRIQEV